MEESLFSLSNGFVIRNDVENLSVKMMQQIQQLMSILTESVPISDQQIQTILKEWQNKQIYTCLFAQDIKTDDIIGFLKIFKERKISHNAAFLWHIEDVVVHENYRNWGIGKQLLQEAICLFQLQNGKYKLHEDYVYALRLYCSPDLIKYYESLGFCNHGSTVMNMKQ